MHLPKILSNKKCALPSPPGTSPKTPVRVPVLVIQLADLKAKPDANHANAHPSHAWSCHICNQLCATPPRRTVSNPTPPGQNRARTHIIGFRSTWPRAPNQRHDAYGPNCAPFMFNFSNLVRIGSLSTLSKETRAISLAMNGKRRVTSR